MSITAKNRTRSPVEARQLHLLQCEECFERLARRLLPDSTPEAIAECARRLAEADVLGLLWGLSSELCRAMTSPSRELLHETKREMRPLLDQYQSIAKIIDQCRQPGKDGTC